MTCKECNGVGSFRCNDCNGTGLETVSCDTCDGKGHVYEQKDNEYIKVACSTCGGSGEIEKTCRTCNGARDFVCSNCNGSGELPDE